MSVPDFLTKFSFFNHTFSRPLVYNLSVSTEKKSISTFFPSFLKRGLSRRYPFFLNFPLFQRLYYYY